jgi:adenine-specific DNA-methyltransferase
MPRPKASTPAVENYDHPEATSLLRPDVGTQAQFKKRKPPQRYRYDSSLSPSLAWDGLNPAREAGEWLLSLLADPQAFADPAAVHDFHDARGALLHRVRSQADAVDLLRRISRPFLDWAGKAERLSFDVPTLPLFVHERLSTRAILTTLKGHKRDTQLSLLDFFGDPQLPIYDQIVRAYEHLGNWTNRMILGDSLVVMNSLLQYEGLGGQVQMIYMDPPYGVKFGSNFQPFVRKRDVAHNDDDDMTREPEMVQAYRDTWELGLHSYLTYMRDRLFLCHDLLAPTGSIFVQISDENVHHVRELMDEVFGAENFVAAINFKTMMPLESGDIESVVDYLCWYARDKSSMKYRNLYAPKNVGEGSEFVFADVPGKNYRRLSADEVHEFSETAANNRVFKRSDLISSGYTPSCTFPIEFEGHVFTTKRGKSWRTNRDGVEQLKEANRLFVLGSKLYYKMYLRDFGFASLTNQWSDTIESEGRLYVVQTTSRVINRCILMTTDPGDLVIDPTCGSGTTAYVAEQWGRRWITADVSRVPLALARQRLLTATFPYYELKDEARGPAGGFVYRRKQNTKGEEVGGIVPHVTLKSIANAEPPAEEVLVDRPDELNKITRVSGPFAFEATIPTPVDWEDQDPTKDLTGLGDLSGLPQDPHGAYTDRMLEILRRSPLLHVGGGVTVTLYNVRPPAKTLALSAEALVDATAPGQSPSIMDAVVEADEKSGRLLPLSRQPVAIVFGPENGAITERTVYEAAREAHAKGYTHLYVIGFAIQSVARGLIEKCDETVGIPATYIQATPDLMMGDLLKTMRSSQIFSVCGLPEVALRRLKPVQPGDPVRYQVELLGLDVFDPTTMKVYPLRGNDVPAWFLDTDYNGLCFHVSQAFFPRTAAWDALKRALKGIYADTVWDHLAGAVSGPFDAGDHGQIAVKVLDDRGNELLVVKSLHEAIEEK